jgi:rhodanese-related sulfurtransferase/thiol-disulfide isomerase/thioredoxin
MARQKPKKAPMKKGNPESARSEAPRTPNRPAVQPTTPGQRLPTMTSVQRRQRRRATLTVLSAGAAVFAVVAVMAFAWPKSGSGADSSAGYNAGKTAFDLPALTGSAHVRLADHQGKPVVVNFFASWCVYCNQELPGFVQVAKAGAGKVDFIGVQSQDTGDGVAMAERFDLAGAGFTLARDIGPSPASKLWSSFGGQGLPATAFYDATGKLVDFSAGMLTEPELQQRIKSAFGLDIQAADAATMQAPVIPLIPQGAAELINTHSQDGSFSVLDVRTPAEYAAGHIQGAANVDAEAADLQSRLSALPRDTSYIVYCRSGNRSGAVTATMHQMGFKHVYDVQGGLNAWTAAGLPSTS